MKVIIPAKKNSTRVPAKNWKPFFANKNLVEIKIEQVLAAVKSADVYLSCDDPSMRVLADKYAINFLQRSPALASDETPWPDAFAGMVSELPVSDDMDVAWVEVINPLFDDYKGMFAKWQEVKGAHDSLVLAAPFNKFVIKGNGQPLNFMYGKWHSMSQNMDPYFTWDSACIMSKKDMLYFSYPIGKRPYIFSTDGASIDIDTPVDFELAQMLYQRKINEGSRA